MSTPKFKAPPVPDPQATPEVAAETEDEAMKKIRKQSGFENTLVTGNLTPNTGKKKLLGG
jgi:hypothetical protein